MLWWGRLARSGEFHVADLEGAQPRWSWSEPSSSLPILPQSASPSPLADLMRPSEIWSGEGLHNAYTCRRGARKWASSSTEEAIVAEKCSIHNRSMVGRVLAVNLLASSSAGSPPKPLHIGGRAPPPLIIFLAVCVNPFRSMQ